MSRPRKPFGATHPGRLPATMMKVLAAEMSDPQRLRRGKQYAHDGSVTDIIIEPGIVICEVQGSRSTPYIAQIKVSAGDGMPLRRDITAHCTCPDDDNWDNHACKHIVAAMFVFSDELLMEPELLDVWRQRQGSPIDADTTGTEPPAARPLATRGHLRLVHSDRTPAHGTRAAGDERNRDERDQDEPTDLPRPARVEHVDPLAHLMSIPDGTDLPDIPELDSVQLPAPRRHELAQTLSDALRHVRIDWD
jgi:uncharacterized Zn finger protein